MEHRMVFAMDMDMCETDAGARSEDPQKELAELVARMEDRFVHADEVVVMQKVPGTIQGNREHDE
jgi:hypothetical protein